MKFKKIVHTDFVCTILNTINYRKTIKKYLYSILSNTDKRALTDNPQNWQLFFARPFSSKTIPSQFLVYGIKTTYPPFMIKTFSMEDGQVKNQFPYERWNYWKQVFNDNMIGDGEYTVLQDLPPMYDKSELLMRPENYMPIWDRFFIMPLPLFTKSQGDIIKIGNEFYLHAYDDMNAESTYTHFYAYNSHVQLKFLIGRYEKKGN